MTSPSYVMCPSGGPRAPGPKTEGAGDYSILAPRPGSLRIDATLHYRKIDQFLLNYVLGEKPGFTSPAVDISSATATVCVAGAGDSAECR